MNKGHSSVLSNVSDNLGIGPIRQWLIRQSCAFLLSNQSAYQLPTTVTTRSLDDCLLGTADSERLSWNVAQSLHHRFDKAYSRDMEALYMTQHAISSLHLLYTKPRPAWSLLGTTFGQPRKLWFMAKRYKIHWLWLCCLGAFFLLSNLVLEARQYQYVSTQQPTRTRSVNATLEVSNTLLLVIVLTDEASSVLSMPFRGRALHDVQDWNGLLLWPVFTLRYQTNQSGMTQIWVISWHKRIQLSDMVRHLHGWVT